MSVTHNPVHLSASGADVNGDRSQGGSPDPGPHHPGSGPHCRGATGNAPCDGAYPADPAAEVLPATITAGCAYSGSVGLHGHHRQCGFISHIHLYTLTCSQEAYSLIYCPLWDHHADCHFIKFNI